MASAPDLIVQTSSVTRTVSPTETLVIGRDRDCDLTLDDPRISRRHIELSHVDGAWWVTDLGSHNGTFVQGTKVTRIAVSGTMVARLADYIDGAEITLFTTGEINGDTRSGRRPTAVYRLDKRLRIGRSPDSNIVLADPLASRDHAELTWEDGKLVLTDLGSRNGSYLNGQRVQHTPVNNGDLVSFGKHQYVFDGVQLMEFVDTGRISLTANDLSVHVGKKKILDGISFDLDQCSLLAVIGPSGAGKSTLLGAFVGGRHRYTGRIEYEGRDLRANFAELRHRIGLVPQDDILHRQLTVRSALDYAARLRLPTDTDRHERERRINSVLAQLELEQFAKQRVDRLSGGQRKRTSVAMELLTEPSLLLLDEPTSGLDPYHERGVMQRLRRLADNGHTVVVVTHSTQDLHMCDRVLVLTGAGKIGYFGPPEGILTHFGASDYASVFEAVTKHPDTWTLRTHKQRHNIVMPTPVAKLPRHSFWSQAAVFSRRMIAVVAADRLYAAMLLALPLGLAALAHAVPGHDGLGLPSPSSAEAQQLLVVLVIGCVFIGASSGIRELIGERAIFDREQSVGLSPLAYVTSKILVFGFISAIQSALLGYLGLLGRAGPTEALVLGDPMVELWVVLATVTLTSAVVGLLISAFVTTTEQTMPVLVGVVMLQLVLSGGLFAIDGAPLDQLSWAMPARWGFAAAAATTDLGTHTPGPADPLWNHNAETWLQAEGMLAVMAILAFLGLAQMLRRRAKVASDT